MKQVAFQDLLTKLNSDDEINVVADGMYITDERKKEALFTNAWYKESEAVITPKVSKIVFKEDLKNAVVVAQTGTVFLESAQKLQKDGLIKSVVPFEDQATFLSAVSTGKVAAGITDSILASYLISHNNNTLYLTIFQKLQEK